MNTVTLQQARPRPRASSAIILYATGLAAFFLPALLWPSSPIDPVAIALNLLVFSLTLYTAYRGQTVAAFFNAICLFFISYPFLLQYAQIVDLTGHGYVKPLSLDTAAIYALYVGIISIVATRNPSEQSPRQAPYRIGPSWFLLCSAFALAIAFLAIFGTAAVFESRIEQYLERNKTAGTVLFLREALRIAPFWVAFMIASSSIQKGRPPLSFPYVVCFLLAFALCNPVNSARFYSLTGVFVALYPILSHYRLVRWLPVAFPLLMTIVLPITSYLRYGLENITWDGIVSIFYSLEFSSLQVLNDGMDYFGDGEWGLGIYTGSALLIFVPRTIWLAKNTGTGQMVGETASYPIANVGISPHFDAYLDFGILGVIVMALVIGYVFKRAYAALGNDFKFGTTKTDLSAAMLGLIPIFVRGDFSVFTIALYSFILTYALVRLITWASLAVSINTAQRPY